MRTGVALLVAAVGFFVLLTIGPFFGFAHFGPCGPDVPGMILFGGMLLCFVGGIAMTFMALVRRGVRWLRGPQFRTR